MREEAVHHSLVTTAMASPWRHCCIQLLSLLLFLCIQASTCLLHEPAVRAPVSTVQDEEAAWRDGRVWTGRALVAADQMLSQLQAPDASRRKLLQTPGAAVPFPPLRVFTNGKPCILFQARKLSVRYEKQKQLDLTERAFSPPVDTSQSVCRGDKATLVMRFGDVEDLRGLFIRLQLSNTFFESSAEWWFSVDSVSLLYNSSEEAVFNVTEVYAPASSSYHCLHVSNLQRFSTLLLPSTEQARRWAVTFTDLQIQAFNITSGKFSPASSCTTFLTPAILMGLVTSLILLLVLAYALHMVIHLKHIEHDEEHKAHVYFPPNPEQCCVENVTEKNNQ